MIFNIKFWSMEKYLPTKRCRNLRQRYVKNNIDVNIKELIERDTPRKIVDIELSDFCEYEINYNCPKCDATLAHKKKEIPIFCPFCGQAIK